MTKKLTLRISALGATHVGQIVGMIFEVLGDPYYGVVTSLDEIAGIATVEFTFSDDDAAHFERLLDITPDAPPDDPSDFVP